MKRLLKKIPGVVKTHKHTTFLLMILRDRWLSDGKQMNDESHLRREWNFESSAEQERHKLMLNAVAREYPDLRKAHVLELGCSDGVFTVSIAERCASVTACDISPVACELAARRCQLYSNVVIRKLDLAHDIIPNQYDVVFAMDVLEYIHGLKLLQSVIKCLAGAIRPGGLLAISSCRLPAELRNAWWMRWLPEGGDTVAQLIATDPDLRMLHLELHPGDDRPINGYIDHIIAVYRKAERSRPAEAVE